MTIRRTRSNNRKEILAECDDCGTELTSEDVDFKDFLEQLKESGWLVGKNDSNEYTHTCNYCAKGMFT